MFGYKNVNVRRVLQIDPSDPNRSLGTRLQVIQNILKI